MDVATRNARTQFVTLGVDQEVFGIPVASVAEILELRPVLRIPDSPPHLAGLIDLRGRSLAVLDLRLRLGLLPVAATRSTRILVLDLEVNGRPLTAGLVVDRVFEVTALDGGIDPPPDIALCGGPGAICGLGRRGDSIVMVFDVASLFSRHEVVALDPAQLSRAAA